MSSLLKSTVIGFGLLAGVAATAYAQSVSTLPPTSPATAPTAAPAPVTSSAQPASPNPGSNSTWREEHYQPGPDYATDKSQHPYSTSIGPQPGSHSSGQDEHYQATDSDNQPGRHPYTSNMGPKPN
jgi:hypothetical protein